MTYCASMCYVEPEKWLRYVIEHIQDWPANRVRDLLPWKVDLTSQ
ncbi:transposase domain-containing protein [Escherichia coli]